MILKRIIVNMNFNLIISLLSLGTIEWLLGIEYNKSGRKLLGAILILISLVINLLDTLKVI